ncbi:hypothetical protein CR513_05456, partial [Mucuna pruriens]
MSLPVLPCCQVCSVLLLGWGRMADFPDGFPLDVSLPWASVPCLLGRTDLRIRHRIAPGSKVWSRGNKKALRSTHRDGVSWQHKFNHQ